ncbi:target of EGR1 protein 1-like [Saccoglossus kowalevskii]
MAWFSQVPVVDVHKDNFHELRPSMQLAIQSATFVAADAELSGLGPRKLLVAHSVDDRYKAMCDIAKSRALISLGLSCFKINPQQTCGDVVSFTVQSFDITMLCNEDYIVEPGALSFLVEHGFDFNKQYSKGIPYYRGVDKDGSDVHQFRELFSEIIKAEKPLIFHNGFLDLVFLYQCFYSELPSSMATFLADLSEIFSGGLFDTKYIAEFHSRMSASYLEYVFRKSQRDNAVNQSKGLKHVTIGFPNYPTAMKCIEYRQCGLPSNIMEPLGTTKLAVELCMQYAGYGHCPLSTKCPKSHDPDQILDQEDSVCENKRKRKRNRNRRKNKHKMEESETKTRKVVQDGLVITEPAGETDENYIDARFDKQPNDPVHLDLNTNKCSGSGIESDKAMHCGTHGTMLEGDGEMHLGMKDESGIKKDVLERTEDKKTKKRADGSGDANETGTMTSAVEKVGLLQKQRMRGHRAGFDAFMTGFSMAAFIANHSTRGISDTETDCSFIEKFSLQDIINRLCLSGKEIPLHVRKSNFSKTSVNHRNKMKKLKEA